MFKQKKAAKLAYYFLNDEKIRSFIQTGKYNSCCVLREMVEYRFRDIGQINCANLNDFLDGLEGLRPEHDYYYFRNAGLKCRSILQTQQT